VVKDNPEHSSATTESAFIVVPLLNAGLLKNNTTEEMPEGCQKEDRQRWLACNGRASLVKRSVRVSCNWSESGSCICLLASGQSLLIFVGGVGGVYVGLTSYSPRSRAQLGSGRRGAGRSGACNRGSGWGKARAIPPTLLLGDSPVIVVPSVPEISAVAELAAPNVDPWSGKIVIQTDNESA